MTRKKTRKVSHRTAKKTTGWSAEKTYKPRAAEYFREKLAYESTPHQLKRDLEARTTVAVDVRDAQAYETERIAGAISAPLTELEKHLSRLPKDKTLVAYCWNITCALAPTAALRLAEKGFRVQELVGGIEEWKKKGMPVETGKPAEAAVA